MPRVDFEGPYVPLLRPDVGASPALPPSSFAGQLIRLLLHLFGASGQNPGARSQTVLRKLLSKHTYVTHHHLLGHLAWIVLRNLY